MAAKLQERGSAKMRALRTLFAGPATVYVCEPRDRTRDDGLERDAAWRHDAAGKPGNA